MHRILVIADDLSGAADCGIAFARSGLDAVVRLGDGGGEINADVLAIDADTRRLAPGAAAQEAARLVDRYLRNEEQVLFKKIDSTLRGNVGVELAAVLEARRRFDLNARFVALLAPAFPASGRTTVNGQQLVHGKPLDETEFWPRQRSCGETPCADPGCLQIDQILAAAGMRAALVDLREIRSGEQHLRRVMLRKALGADVLVCDAETDEDLGAIADASMALGSGTVWAGSAGLAYHLPGAAGLHADPLTPLPPIPNSAFASGPTLFAIGSISSVSRRQVEELATMGDLVRITITSDALQAGEQSPVMERHKQQVEEALRAGRDVLLVTGMEPPFDVSTVPQPSAALAALVMPFVRRLGGLVASGGETARAILQAWGVCTLRLIGELEPGLPLSITENWSARLPILTKAGGFGGPQTLLHCQRFLRELDRSSYAAARRGVADGD